MKKAININKILLRNKLLIEENYERRLGLTKNPRRERRAAEFNSSERNFWIYNIVPQICGKKLLHLSSAYVYYYYIKNDIIIKVIQTSTILYDIKILFLLQSPIKFLARFILLSKIHLNTNR
jgi:hypothetical protein